MFRKETHAVYCSCCALPTNKMRRRVCAGCGQSIGRLSGGGKSEGETAQRVRSESARADKPQEMALGACRPSVKRSAVCRPRRAASTWTAMAQPLVTWRVPLLLLVPHYNNPFAQPGMLPIHPRNDHQPAPRRGLHHAPAVEARAHLPAPVPSTALVIFSSIPAAWKTRTGPRRHPRAPCQTSPHVHH